jgi:hypothetical protein
MATIDRSMGEPIVVSAIDGYVQIFERDSLLDLVGLMPDEADAVADALRVESLRARGLAG